MEGFDVRLFRIVAWFLLVLLLCTCSSTHRSACSSPCNSACEGRNTETCDATAQSPSSASSSPEITSDASVLASEHSLIGEDPVETSTRDSAVGQEPTPDPRPAPLNASKPILLLPVAGFGDAVVSLPLGTHDPRPVVLAAHGNYDTPESQCAVWRSIVGNDAFVLCTRGIARADSPSRRDIRYEYASNQHLEKEIDAAVKALRATYSDYVAEGSFVYAGFSLGAIMGVSMMMRHPDRYSRAVLIEGGQKAWSTTAAKEFFERGGQRILFACGQWECEQQSKAAGRILEKAGVSTRVVLAKGEGHTYGGGVADEIALAFDWVVEGEPQWAHRHTP